MTAAVAVTMLGAGCSYHNVIHNAEGLFFEAEDLRRAGRDSLAEVRYRDVVRKTGEALRAKPESDWSTDALTLMGRSRLRLGELREARIALANARDEGDPPRPDVLVYLAVVQAELGDRQGALAQVNLALGGDGGGVAGGALDPSARAEAHLLRGRLLLERGYADQAWWDLDRAADLEPGARVEAGIERLRWGVALDDQPRAQRALDGLLADSRAGARMDTITALVSAASEEWGPGATAGLLAGADSSAWDRVDRGRVALVRARLLAATGDTAAAADQALLVAGGFGASAAEARLLLAQWRASVARDLSQVYALRGLLLPSEDESEVVAERLQALDDLETFAGVGLDDPLGWFAAAEVARDGLGAHYVARGLFLAYADGAPEEPWAPKALLAALDISPDEGDRAWLRGRLEAHRRSPYVLAALGGSATDFQDLEEELDVRLRELTRR
jgi:tetratricopeptide (TPR) repeat protein